MSLEELILIFTWIVALLCFWFFIPRAKRREAHVAFLFMQVLTWLFGLLVVEQGWIEYPIREFNTATEASFTFEFFVYPVICAFFNVYYPDKGSIFMKIRHYLLYCTAITGLELILAKYTQLIKYVHWTGYWSLLTLFLTFLISRIYYCWFFKTKQ